MTRLTRLLTAAATTATVALGAAAAAAPVAHAERTNDLAKPIVLLTGPEVVGDPCAAMQPIATAIQRSSPTVNGTKLTFSGSIHTISINAKGPACTKPNAVAITGGSVHEAGIALGRELERINAEKGAVDVVAAGSAGVVLRYALLMSARRRAGLTIGEANRFPLRLDVEDAIALSSPMDGMPAAYSGCGATAFCTDLQKAVAPDPLQLHWTLLGSDAAGGTNPQGVRGTDWSVFAFGGDRFVAPDSATGMAAAHRTIYTDDAMTFMKGLADSSAKNDAKLRFAHGAGAEYTATTKGAHVAQRVAQDVVYGVSADAAATGQGPAFAEGCVGFNDSGTGETLIVDPELLNWAGDPKAVRTVKFGTLDAVADCFKADPKEAGTFVVDRPGAVVRVNGLDYVLGRQGDAKLKIDTKKRRLWRAGGSIALRLPVTSGTSLPLWNFNASTAAVKDLDFRFPTTDGAIQTQDGTPYTIDGSTVQLFGLQSKGAVSLKIVKGATQLDLALALPGFFSTRLTGTSMVQCSDGLDNDKDGKSDLKDEDCAGDLAGDFEDRSQASGFGVVLATNNTSGLVVDKVAGKFGGSLRFGPFRSEGNVAVEYSPAENDWKVAIEAKVPSLSDIGVKLRVGFRGTQLTSIYGEANGLDIPLWSSGFFLQRFGLGANGLGPGQQREILIGVAISFLKKIAGSNVILWDGDLSVGWGAPWKAKLEGSLKIADVTIGSGSVEYEHGAGAKIAAKLGREIPFNGGKAKLLPTGTLVGQASNFGELDLGASVQLCIKGELRWRTFEEPFCAGKADMRLTRYVGQPITQVYCLKTNFTGGFVDWSVGFVTKYAFLPTGLHTTIDWIENSCDVADHGGKPSAVATRAQVGGPGATDGFTIRPGTDRQVVTVRGDGEAPNVTLIAPDGTRYATPERQMAEQYDRVFVITGMGDRTAFALAQPQVGRWRVEVAAGSPAVVGVDQLEVLPQPEVSGSVSRGEAGRFVLRHAVKAAPGQSVRFYERGGAVLKEVARSTGGRATKRFTPAFAATAGRRDLVAVVFQDGRRRTEQVVASYRAPAAAKPGRVAKLAVSHRGNRLRISWGRARGATGGYAVEVQRPDGRSDSRIVRRTSLVLGGVVARGRTAVTVRALRRQDEASGPARTVVHREGRR